jgi:hypothetical protein
MGGELGQRVSAAEPRSSYKQTIGSPLPGLPGGRQHVGASLAGDEQAGQPVFHVAAHLQKEASAYKGWPKQLVSRAGSGKGAQKRTIEVAGYASGPLNKATSAF